MTAKKNVLISYAFKEMLELKAEGRYRIINTLLILQANLVDLSKVFITQFLS